jgi:F-type H+-transporting ATPase subunit b
MLQYPLAPPRQNARCARLVGHGVRAAALVMLIVLIAAPAAAAQPAHAEPGAASPAAAEEDHGPGVLQTVARLFNFAVLVGVLVYYLRAPLAAYLASRSTEIRQDLVTAAETRAAATAQLAEIRARLRSLPEELEALKKQSASEIAAEKARLARAATLERERLLAATRREIEHRVRIARRELVELAAELAVRIARERIVRTITPADHITLVDRYTQHLAGRGVG